VVQAGANSRRSACALQVTSEQVLSGSGLRVPSGLAEHLLNCADETRYGALVHTAVMTGLRLGELLGLRWQDLDLNGAVLHVRQTCQWMSSRGYIFRAPKTYRSARPVALTPLAAERLRKHRLQQLEDRLAVGSYEDNDLVFADAIGRPIYPGTLRANWLRIVKAAGFGHLRFHDLRHIHASLLLHEGIHPKIVSERLGHSAVRITLDTYSHVLPSLQADAVLKLDKLLGRKLRGKFH